MALFGKVDSSLMERKEGRFGVLRHFQQIRLYLDEIETWNREEIHLFFTNSSRGLSFAEGP